MKLSSFVQDIRNSVADIHENSSLPGLGNTKHQESDHVKTTNEITLSKDVFMSSADFVPPLESSSMFGSGNINVMDLFDDFYGMSDKHGGADKIGNLSDTLNTGADFNHSTNIDSEVSSLEFKGVHSNICNQESNSHQDQVMFLSAPLCFSYHPVHLSFSIFVPNIFFKLKQLYYGFI